MKTLKTLKITLLVLAMGLFATNTSAQTRRGHMRQQPPRMAMMRNNHHTLRPVVHQPDAMQRLRLAMIYLDTHRYINASQYAQLTHLSLRAAEAELDAFATQHHAPLRLVFRGSKKAYVKMA